MHTCGNRSISEIIYHYHDMEIILQLEIISYEIKKGSRSQ